MTTENKEVDQEKLEKIKLEIKALYEATKSVRCPYLDEDVFFNNSGFSHLLTRSWNRGRSTLEQYQRLRLFPRAVEVIKKSHLVQEHEVRHDFVRTSANSKWGKTLKNITYYAFVSVFPQVGLRIKVVVKQVEGGRPFFWSVYPSWKIEIDGEGYKKKVFCSGNLETD